MNSFRTNILTATSLLILISLFVMTRSNTGYSDAARDVKVINTASEPVPVTGTTTLSAPVQSQQSGAWNIGINSSASSPLLVRDVDNPARQAFQKSISVTFQDGQSSVDQPITVVPSGKRLVIEQLTFRGDVASGRKMRATIRTIVNSNTAFHQLVLAEELFETHANFVTDHTMRIYADALTAVTAEVLVFADSVPSVGFPPTFIVSISGHFIDMP
jgi:hypothetical protein